MPTPEDHEPPAPADPFEGLVLDDDFVRDAQHSEGSARARGLAAKWKREPPGDTSFRPPPGRPRRKFPWQPVLMVCVAAALVAALLDAKGIHSWVSGKPNGGVAAAPVATPSLDAPETALPTAPPTSPPGPAVGDVAHPFLGSPALTWPEGAKAIVVPPAHAVGIYDRSDVASYLRSTRSLLIDSNLDPKVLAGGYPSAALALLDPRETSTVASLKKSLTHPSAAWDATDLFSRFNPDQAVIDGSVIKVKGEMTYRNDGQGGLAIHADYTFVYPLRPGPHPDVVVPGSGPTSAAPASWRLAGSDTDVARSIVRRIIDLDIPNPAHFVHTRGTLWVHNLDHSTGNTACGLDNGYINPQFPETAADGGGPTPNGPAVDPYDRSKLPVDGKPGSCGLDSRT